jgi:hypothetical protein
MSDVGAPILTNLTIGNRVLRDTAAFIGEIARPFAIISCSGASAKAIVVLALKVNSPEASVFIGAVFLGVGALYGAKAWEKVSQTRADAEVKKEQAKAA